MVLPHVDFCMHKTTWCFLFLSSTPSTTWSHRTASLACCTLTPPPPKDTFSKFQGRFVSNALCATGNYPQLLRCSYHLTCKTVAEGVLFRGAIHSHNNIWGWGGGTNSSAFILNGSNFQNLLLSAKVKFHGYVSPRFSKKKKRKEKQTEKKNLLTVSSKLNFSFIGILYSAAS